MKKLISILDHIKKCPNMYIGETDAYAMQHLLFGIWLGFTGIDEGHLSLDPINKAWDKRGYQESSNRISEMKKSGKNETEVIHELIEIYKEAIISFSN